MCNNSSNNILIVSTTISAWIFNNFSANIVNYLANLLEMIGQNLSSMIALDNTTEDNCNDSNSISN